MVPHRQPPPLPNRWVVSLELPPTRGEWARFLAIAAFLLYVADMPAAESLLYAALFNVPLRLNRK